MSPNVIPCSFYIIIVGENPGYQDPIGEEGTEGILLFDKC